MCGIILFSMILAILAIGESREMGLWEVPIPGSLLGLGIGMLFASFQICGMMFWFSERLKIWVR